MFKGFEVKFETHMQLALGWSKEMTGSESDTHTVYIGPWRIIITVR